MPSRLLVTALAVAVLSLFAVRSAVGQTVPVRFVAIGDFGTGSENQYGVASAIADVCARDGCDFVLGLGDNIYERGVADAYDAQFDSKFEDPYEVLGSLPFHMTLGNHDNSYDPIFGSELGEAAGAASDEFTGLGAGHWFESGNREVAYHYRTDRKSTKWQMPARFYEFQKENVAFFALDTNTLMYLGIPFPPIEQDVAMAINDVLNKQELWIGQALPASTADWKIAFGHHPYRSNGEHGNAGTYEGVPASPISGVYVKLFYEQFICGKVDLVITGHDHDLEWLKPVPACGGTEFIISGAAAKTRDFPSYGELGPDFFREENQYYSEVPSTLGFFWIEIAGNQLTGVIYTVTRNTDGSYTTAESFRRTKTR